MAIADEVMLQSLPGLAMAKHWMEAADTTKHRDFMTGAQDAGGLPVNPARTGPVVYFVRECGFTFQFPSLRHLQEAIAWFSRKTQPSTMEPGIDLEHYRQRWHERLPKGLAAGSKRERILRALHRAAEDFEVMSNDDKLHQLGELMSAVSELCQYAGWMGGTEYCVPELCRRALATGNVQLWGRWGVSPNASRCMTRLADEIGSWAEPDDASIGYDPFDPFPIPEEYETYLEREAAIREDPAELERGILTAEWLRAGRAKRGLTQAVLAESLSVSANQISCWENGRSFPDEEMVLLLRQELGGAPGDLHEFVLPRML